MQDSSFVANYRGNSKANSSLQGCDFVANSRVNPEHNSGLQDSDIIQNLVKTKDSNYSQNQAQSCLGYDDVSNGRTMSQIGFIGSNVSNQIQDTNSNSKVNNESNYEVNNESNNESNNNKLVSNNVSRVSAIPRTSNFRTFKLVFSHKLRKPVDKQK